MPITRRDFLRTGAVAAAVTAVPRPLLVQLGRTPEPIPPIDDPRLKALTDRAIESAQRAGASYADVRLSHVRQRGFSPEDTHDQESMTVGVRALVNGYWGFASSPIWSPDEMARLGREAVRLANIGAAGKPRRVELAPVPVVPNGHWTMPIARDPFAMSPFEVQDFLSGLMIFIETVPGLQPKSITAGSRVQEWAFASTAGSFYTQRLHHTWGTIAMFVSVKKPDRTAELGLDCLTPAGLGWELFAADRIPRVRDHSLYDEIRRQTEELKELLVLPIKPVDVGRYDTVLDAPTVARLVDATLGRATELDRALGYEANASGTSYLNDPFAMVGSYQAGAPALTLTADRSEPGAAATVQWDDEGVAPDPFTIVKDGTLVDFQTTRESAGWLADYYTRRGVPVHSHGCAAAQSALHAPLVRTPNLTIAPGRGAQDFTALVAGLGKGVAVKHGGAEMDFQAAGGLGGGSVYEVKGGKPVAQLSAAGFLFRSTELWKALGALGGDASVRRYGTEEPKGEPEQYRFHSVSAPPAIVKGLTFIDRLRKA